MGGIIVNDRAIAVPGEDLADGMDYLPGEHTFRDGEKIIAMMVGVVNISGRQIKLTPLSGPYIPKRGDIVIGEVTNVGLGGWRINIGWHFDANLSVKDATSDFVPRGENLSRYFDYGDYIVCQIINVGGAKVVDLSMNGPGLRKLGVGRIFKVPSSKVPRIIGKQGSMINMIKESTGCRISVGQNGIVWLGCDDPAKEMKAYNTIKKIVEESHTSGLTDRIKEFLESSKNGL